jgi:hypothetical protein
MKLENLYRIDYPIFSPVEEGGGYAIGIDYDSYIEKQPLGLVFQFASLSKGLMVEIENDAEQIACQVREVASLLPASPDYFGFTSPVVSTSDLHGLLGAELQRIYFGYMDGEAPDARLFFGVKLQFESAELAFVNNCDEGLYLLRSSPRYDQYFAWFTGLYTCLKWHEQPELLAQLASR